MLQQRSYSATQAEPYKTSRWWADKYTPEVISIIQTEFRKRKGPLVRVREASFYDDVSKASDLLVTSGNSSAGIAMRVRKFEDYSRYGHQFTIRLERSTGSSTELAKVIDQQMARYLFYGFASEEGATLHSWFIARLDVLRQALKEDPSLLDRAEIRTNKPEGEKIVSFICFNLSDLPSEFIIERKI